jgi:serine/threonine protein kinase
LNLPTNKNPPWVLKQFFEEGNFPPAGLLLEYIYDAEPLSLQNITPAIATKAVQGLAKIHSARVLHRDLATNNILVCKGNVVWIGFEFSRTYASETPVEQRLGFRQEMSKLWTDLFTKMVCRIVVLVSPS